jgi:hypothetical protein
MVIKIVIKAILLATSAAALNASCSPGGNFDLSTWDLQLPIGSPGAVETISSNSLQGCSGWQDFDYFFTESSDGALVMKVPGSVASSGCVTTPNSQHCRTELHEKGSWDPNDENNRLIVTLSVPLPDNSGHGTVIGQIHILDSISTSVNTTTLYSSLLI